MSDSTRRRIWDEFLNPIHPTALRAHGERSRRPPSESLTHAAFKGPGHSRSPAFSPALFTQVRVRGIPGSCLSEPCIHMTGVSPISSTPLPLLPAFLLTLLPLLSALLPLLFALPPTLLLR